MHYAILLSRLKSELIQKGFQVSEASSRDVFPIGGEYQWLRDPDSQATSHKISVASNSEIARLMTMLHEYGHSVSQGKKSNKSISRYTQAFNRGILGNPTWMDKMILYWEELRAWRYAWKKAQEIGFTNKKLFLDTKDFCLMTYETAFWGKPNATSKTNSSIPYYIGGDIGFRRAKAPTEQPEAGLLKGEAASTPTRSKGNNS